MITLLTTALFDLAVLGAKHSSSGAFTLMALIFPLEHSLRASYSFFVSNVALVNIFTVVVACMVFSPYLTYLSGRVGAQMEGGVANQSTDRSRARHFGGHLGDPATPGPGAPAEESVAHRGVRLG